MRSFFLVLLASLVLTGCASSGRLSKFDLTARAYERAVRWSDFQKAFALTAEPDAAVPDFAALQQFQVTSYDIVNAARPNEDAMQVTQVVEISYVNRSRMAERRLVDRQLWVYSPSDDRWKLKSAFPVFR